jgi:hypothetical protein
MSAHFVKTARRECPLKSLNRRNILIYKAFNDVISNTAVSQHYQSGKSADFVNRKGALGSPLIKAKNPRRTILLASRALCSKPRSGMSAD